LEDAVGIYLSTATDAGASAYLDTEDAGKAMSLATKENDRLVSKINQSIPTVLININYQQSSGLNN
jgi:hypothetical protein